MNEAPFKLIRYNSEYRNSLINKAANERLARAGSATFKTLLARALGDLALRLEPDLSDPKVSKKYSFSTHKLIIG